LKTTEYESCDEITGNNGVDCDKKQLEKEKDTL